MLSATFLITFMVMALFYVLCDAVPQVPSLAHTLSDHFNSTDTGVSMAAMDDPDDIEHVPNLNGDVWKSLNRCYYWDYSEKWIDVGGKHSQFVHDAVDQMCQVIAAYVTSTGFMKDDTMSVCKPVDKGTQGRNYDRSIAVKVTYRGRSNTEVDRFSGFDSRYCFNLMARALDCDAGGEWIVPYGGSPRDYWEAKADPNRNSCSDNGYATIFVITSSSSSTKPAAKKQRTGRRKTINQLPQVDLRASDVAIISDSDDEIEDEIKVLGAVDGLGNTTSVADLVA